MGTVRAMDVRWDVILQILQSANSCYNLDMENLTGQRFNRLVVQRFVGKRGNVAYWECLCDCGNTRHIARSNLFSKKSPAQSCGCYAKERTSQRSKKHGMKNSREYSSWAQMKDRCLNTKSCNWDDYGGRGITVCERWLIFENFFADMGIRPEGFTLGRKNNNEGYCIENCEWQTVETQNRNKRTSVVITYQGKTKTVAEWARELNIKAITIYSRIDRGWTYEQALSGKR